MNSEERGIQRLLGDVRAMGGLIERCADADEDATQISDEVMQALTNAGVFKLMAPAELGGFEAHPLEVFEVIKTLSYLDGSTGWYCQAATTGVAVAGAFLGEQAIKDIFRSGRAPTCAGQAAPTGKAERVDGGYRISGSFSFGSGTPNASWIVGGYLLHESGRLVLRDGNPVMLIALAPREQVEMLGNWNVLGLRGTGSYDFKVREQVVHQDFVFDAGNPQAQRGGALYRMGFFGIPTLCHASFGAGCAHRILDEWARYARQKKRPPKGTVSEMESFQKDLAIAHAQVRAAEAYVRSTFEQLYRCAQSGSIPAQLNLDSRLCASNMLAVGTRVAQTAFTSSATTGLRNGSALQRCFRDMQAGNAHFLTGEQSFIDSGRALAARDQ
ncbi:MAG TPA: acyl-CoA dehydrogenase family protein [Steroidobacteraceae bacterium]|jgi:alkylation response protein AidB-like acyl-CoA dehydrogenase|nr:acyl-CoA dehydrogenase family protein [Steroidobacteraceae bacterium]